VPDWDLRYEAQGTTLRGRCPEILAIAAAIAMHCESIIPPTRPMALFGEMRSHLAQALAAILLRVFSDHDKGGSTFRWSHHGSPWEAWKFWSEWRNCAGRVYNVDGKEGSL
jgi:hypothetical protein